MSNPKVSLSLPFIPIGWLLGLTFVVLKLVGTIDWPWLWVLAPIWVSMALGLIFMVIVALFVGGVFATVLRSRDKWDW